MQHRSKLPTFAAAALGLGLITLHAQVQLDDTVVTATPEPRRSFAIAAPVTIIDRAAIDQSRAVDVPDLLRAIGGIEVVDTTGSRGRTTSVDMRGFGETAASNLAVIVDGRTVNQPTLAGVDWTTIPLARVQRIEIVRGAGAVMYGENATAGVINIITRRSAESEDDVQVILDSRVGTYSDWRHSLSAFAGDERFSWHADATHSDFDGYRDNSDVEYDAFGFGLSLSPDDAFRLTLDGGWKEDEFGLPGAIAPNQPPTSTNRPGDRVESEDFYLAATPEFFLTNGLALRIPIHYREVSYAADNSGFLIENRIRQTDVRPSVSFDASYLDLAHRISVGFDWKRGELDEAVNMEPAVRQELAAWIKDQITITDRLHLDLGLRLANVDFDYQKLQDADDDLLAASAGISYRYAEKSRVFLSAQQGYRSQTLDELIYPFPTYAATNPVVDTQLSRTVQLGVNHAFSDAFSAGATVFVIDTDDEIFYDPSTFLNTNYEQTRRYGLELEAIAKPTDNLTLSGYLTFLDSKLRGGAYDGNPVPSTTPVSLRLNADWQPVERLSINARLRYSQDRTLVSDWADADPSWDDSFVVADVSASWKFTEIVTVYAGCTNVFNESYSEYGIVTAGGDFTYGTPDDGVAHYPSPDRAFFGGVRLTFRF